MEGAKFCPVAGVDCRKEQCAWWDKYINECAVLSMMLALWADVDEDEDDDEEEKEDENKDKDQEDEDDDGEEDDGESDKEDEAGKENDTEFAGGEVKEFQVKVKKI